MLRCEECEYFRRKADGSPHLLCDPFSTVKEPECLIKWQLVQLGTMVKSHQATLDMYRRLAPLQEKMFRHMEREIDEAEDADRWKFRPFNDGNDDPSRRSDDPDDPFRV